MIPRLCKVPAGYFIMGGKEEDILSHEYPLRSVYLDEFYIDETVVTCNQYEVFIEWMLKTNDHSRCHPNEPPNKDHRPLIGNHDFFYQDNQPITGIDWFDAYAYAAWAGLRLPTEAEWEKAARGTDGRTWPWGNKSGLQINMLQALYDDDGYWNPNPRLTSVYDHFKGVSPFGCLGMAGNVWEYCQDSFDISWYDKMPNKNPLNDLFLKMVVSRGGCWKQNEHDAMSCLRIGVDRLLKNSNPIYGFRCASDTPAPKGAIGSTRHLKPKNDNKPPNQKWNKIINSQGEEHYEGDTINSAQELFLEIGETANLHDYLLIYSTPPPILWAKRFSNVNFREQYRTTNQSQKLELNNGRTQSILKYIVSSSEEYSSPLEAFFSKFLSALIDNSRLPKNIQCDFSPSYQINSFSKLLAKGEYKITFNAGLFLIHDCLGAVLAEILSDEFDAYKLRRQLVDLGAFIVRGREENTIPPEIKLPTFNNLSLIIESQKLADLMSIFVLSHELAHIKLGHTDQDKSLSMDEYWQRELAADSLGIDIALNSNEVKEWPKGFAVALGFWSQFLRALDNEPHPVAIAIKAIQNPLGDISDLSETHPHMARRMMNLKGSFPIELKEAFVFGFQCFKKVCGFQDFRHLF